MSSGLTTTWFNDTRVTVGILTYHRPETIVECLRSVIGQLTPFQFRVVVVDNDPMGSAERVVGQVAETSGVPIRYVIEAIPGIAAARNRAVSESAGDDVIVFIDDDEFASPEWLSELVTGLLRHQADVAHGRVLPLLEAGGPGWVVEGGFFAREMEADGSQLSMAATCNVAIRLECLRLVEGPFRLDLGLTGGEDTDLFERLHRLGARMVSIPSSVVFEHIPLARQTKTWLIRRSVRGAAGWVDVLRTVRHPRWWRLERLLASFWHVAVGAVLVVASGFGWRDSVMLVRGLQRVGLSWGTVLGLLGRRVEEYARAEEAED